MSVTLLRQVFARSQPLLCHRAAQAAAVRLNSTSAQETADRQWGQILTEGQPKDPYHAKTPIEELWRSHSDGFMATLKLKPRDAYTGRTVEVVDGDVARSAKILDRVIAQNNVARDWFTNRRHRQKGEERRRMRSMRWRRRFKHEVGKKVELVKQIRLRGA